MDFDGVTRVVNDGTEIKGVWFGSQFVWPDPWTDIWDEGVNVIWDSVWRDAWSVDYSQVVPEGRRN
jgi:hypothetical protein